MRCQRQAAYIRMTSEDAFSRDSLSLRHDRLVALPPALHAPIVLALLVFTLNPR